MYGWPAIVLILFLAIAAPASRAADENAAMDALSLDEIAVEVTNPIGRLSSLASELSRERFQGSLPDAGSRSQGSYTLTPSVAFGLSSGRRVVARVSVPIAFTTPTYIEDGVDHADWLIRKRADVLARDGYFVDGHGHLDDISFDVAYGGETGNGWSWMAGLAGVIPTSEDLSVAREQYLLGPEFAFGKTWGRGIAGAWVKHLVNVSGGSNPWIPYDFDTRETRIRLYFTHSLGNGWQLVSNPEIVYDWEGVKNNRLLLPLGGGVSKTLKLGRVPVKFDLEAYSYLESPDAFGPDWQLKFRFTPLLPNWFTD